MAADFDEKTERNKRIQERYDELMREGKHGHYETMFKIVHEEVERAVTSEQISNAILASRVF